MELRYGIVGVGALGGFYGGKLAYHGNDVHFLFRGDYQHVKDNGLRIDSVDGDFILSQLNAYKESSDMPQCDVVLVCLKTTNNQKLKTILPPLLHKDTVVILVQNGLGAEADLANDFPSLNIAGGLAYIGSSKIAPGHIIHQNYGELSIGSYSCSNLNILEKIVNDLQKAGIKSQLVDLNSARWRKLVWNIPYNGMTVVLDGKVDDLTACPSTQELVLKMMEEVIAASKAIGIKEAITEDVVEEAICFSKNMSAYPTSMKLDYDHHRPLEIESIYSRPLEEARKAGIEMSCVAMLEQQLKFLMMRKGLL